MKAIIPYVEKKFEEFNQLMFDDKLPMPPIELSDAKTFLEGAERWICDGTRIYKQ